MTTAVIGFPRIWENYPFLQ